MQFTRSCSYEDPGFQGFCWAGGRGASREVRMVLSFGADGMMRGHGHDSNGSFNVTGQFNAKQAEFVVSYDNPLVGKQTFKGLRKSDMSISGKWFVQDGTSGDFHFFHPDSDKRFPPSYEKDRLQIYQVLNRIATGGFGTVSRVLRVFDGKILVWKELNYSRMNKKERRMMITEVNILREVDHAHVVKYYDTIILRDEQKIYIIIEYCSNGDVGAMIDRCKSKKSRMEEAFIWRVLSQILQALQSCHNREEIILHRDLKPANILLDDAYMVKVADFGLAAVVNSDSIASSKVGTPLYMSPEQISGAGYTAKSDIWSLGCIVYEIAALRPPFDAQNQMELAHFIREGKFSRIPDLYSPDLHRVICWMLQQAPKSRPSADELLSYMQRLDVGRASPVSSPNVKGSSSYFESFHHISSARFSGQDVKRTPDQNYGWQRQERSEELVEELEGIKLALRNQEYLVHSVDVEAVEMKGGSVLVGDEVKAIQGREISGWRPEALKQYIRAMRKELKGGGELSLCLLRQSHLGGAAFVITNVTVKDLQHQGEHGALDGIRRDGWSAEGRTEGKNHSQEGLLLPSQLRPDVGLGSPTRQQVPLVPKLLLDGIGSEGGSRENRSAREVKSPSSMHQQRVHLTSTNPLHNLISPRFLEERPRKLISPVHRESNGHHLAVLEEKHAEALSYDLSAPRGNPLGVQPAQRYGNRTSHVHSEHVPLNDQAERQAERQAACPPSVQMTSESDATVEELKAWETRLRSWEEALKKKDEELQQQEKSLNAKLEEAVQARRRERELLAALDRRNAELQHVRDALFKVVEKGLPPSESLVVGNVQVR
uniref:non-specific serine/threonine protein kinase n=1 Tax=Guillardia theta TaxID=55529 RepID=A0A7S4J805_GUITH|mmetsp:Transcript_13893/g.48019  ORF Transcript_13893/g.48019 Transcript_13893/m.48019 type:complete len:827 (+) Transcript_13893:165-2645(+)